MIASMIARTTRKIIALTFLEIFKFSESLLGDSVLGIISALGLKLCVYTTKVVLNDREVTICSFATLATLKKN
jgi:hypothetical protein